MTVSTNAAHALRAPQADDHVSSSVAAFDHAVANASAHSLQLTDGQAAEVAEVAIGAVRAERKTPSESARDLAATAYGSERRGEGSGLKALQMIRNALDEIGGPAATAIATELIRYIYPSAVTI